MVLGPQHTHQWALPSTSVNPTPRGLGDHTATPVLGRGWAPRTWPESPPALLLSARTREEEAWHGARSPSCKSMCSVIKCVPGYSRSPEGARAWAGMDCLARCVSVAHVGIAWRPAPNTLLDLGPPGLAPQAKSHRVPQTTPVTLFEEVPGV